MMRPFLIAAFLASVPPALATAQETQTATMTAVPEWKAVYGRIEARDEIPARARLGGTLEELDVSEGDLVTAGQTLAVVVDEKLDSQLAALDAQMQALQSQYRNAETELKRGEELKTRGVITTQRLDELRTQVDVFRNQIASLAAERHVIEQQASEGAVLSPLAGRVLDVPVAIGAVVLPGELVATIGGGGFFLRLSIPERHAAALTEGSAIQLEEAGSQQEGRLVKIYPQIEGGRVLADVEVPELSDAFVGTRMLVRLPVGARDALLIPASAVTTRSGLDFATVQTDHGMIQRTVLPGQRYVIDGVEMVEIVAGLNAGETVVASDE